ncbi:MAG: Hpt domain-containing protein [Candidatus Krumholzibacteriia bacterium]
MTQQDAPTGGCALDLDTALENLDGDTDLLREVAEMFVEIGPDQLAEIEAFIAAGDAPAVATSAHGMKGGASNLGAVEFVRAALDLELLSKAGSLDGAVERLAAMRAAFVRLRDQLDVLDWNDLA